LHTESICYRGRRTPVSFIADISGNYRLTIEALEAGSIVGRHKILVEEIRRAGPHDSSRIFAEQAFKEAERLHAGRAPGNGLRAVSKYEEARKHWLVAGDQRAAIRALINTGQAYQGMSRFEQALAIYRQALALSRTRRDLHAEAVSRNNIGFLLFQVGDNQQALAQAAHARLLTRIIRDHSGEAQSLYTLGRVNYNFGDLPQALRYYQQALQIWKQLNAYDKQAEVLVEFGYTYTGMSAIPAAFDSFNQALSLSRAASARHVEAVALRAFGNLQSKLGENQQAFNLFLQALEILEQVEDPYLKAAVLGGLAYAYDHTGEQRRALEYYEQAVAILRSLNARGGVAEAEMTIGNVYHALGESEKALTHYQQALPLFRALKMSRLEAMVLRDTGLVYDSMDDKTKALAYYRRSLYLTRTGQDQRYEAYTLSYIGRIYERNGDRLMALSYYQRALRLSRVGADRAGESLMLSNLAHLEQDRGNLDKARAYIEAAIEITESLRAKLGSLDLRATYFASARQYYDLYIDILMRLHEQRPDAKFDIAAFEASEKARARSLLESLREASAGIRQGVDPALLKQERELQQLLNAKAEHQARLITGDQGAEAEALAKEIAQITAQYDEVKARIRSSSVRYAALKQPQPLSLGEVQQRVLDDDSLLLEYALGDDRSYLWAVTRTGLFSFVLPARAEIEAASRRYYGLLTAGQMTPGEQLAQYQARVKQAEAQIGAANATLSGFLLGAVASKLTYRRLLIVADGALQYIPFQALTAPNSGGDVQEPLIFKHEVVNEPSASALALLLDETARRKPAPNAVAVLADPVFEPDDPRFRSAGAAQRAKADKPIELRQALRDVGVTGGEIPRLFASREEAKAIMAVAPWRSAFKATDFEASRATATSRDLSQYRIIHFATHGFLNNEHPELSGIVLSLVDRGGRPQDGFLRLHDIYNLQLPVDLVVLSACNTGLGKDVKGEGLIGLTRGFMYAGAAGVVASLWKVDDEATAALMQRFYEHMLKKGLAPAAALRESQLAMLKEKRWRSPYHWAGFVIQGQYATANFATPPRQAVAKYFLAWGGVAAFLSFFLMLAWRVRRRRAARQNSK
jgi:CHAT domain-containing protein